MKYSVSKGPLLSSTHAVTTSARPGDTPWVNKWGACQSAHHNSSETVVCREDLAILGFGFLQLCCCSSSPSQITLSPSATWTWGREWPLLCWVVFWALQANLLSQFVSDHVACDGGGFLVWDTEECPCQVKPTIWSYNHVLEGLLSSSAATYRPVNPYFQVILCWTCCWPGDVFLCKSPSARVKRAFVCNLSWGPRLHPLCRNK